MTQYNVPLSEDAEEVEDSSLDTTGFNRTSELWLSDPENFVIKPIKKKIPNGQKTDTEKDESIIQVVRIWI